VKECLNKVTKTEEINEVPKKILITLKNGQNIATKWFEDNEKEFVSSEMTTKENQEYELILRQKHIEKIEVENWRIIKKRSAENIYVTKHGYKRLRERNGWNKKTADRMLIKIYNDGLDLRDISNTCKEWAMEVGRQHSDSDVYKIYGDKVYVFKYTTLITTLFIPANIIKKIKKG